MSISETHYLHNVVGDTEIMKGEGMELDQLFQNALYMRGKNANIHPFDLRRLGEAFRIRETTPVHLPSVRHPIHVFVYSVGPFLLGGWRGLAWCCELCDIKAFLFGVNSLRRGSVPQL